MLQKRTIFKNLSLKQSNSQGMLLVPGKQGTLSISFDLELTPRCILLRIP